jgi:hypothetical protein
MILLVLVGQLIPVATSPVPYFAIVSLLSPLLICLYLFNLFSALCSCGYSCNRIGPWQAKILFYSRGYCILSEMAPTYEPCLAIFDKVSIDNFMLTKNWAALFHVTM